MIALLAFAIEGQAAATILECVAEYPDSSRGITYQVTFDDVAHTISRDGGKPRKAQITETLISWNEAATYGTAAWTIDRLTGAWRFDKYYKIGIGGDDRSVGGKCTAPPPQKF